MESDEALYARVKHGDMLAFDELYSRYAAAALRLPAGPAADRAPTPRTSSTRRMMATLESDEVVFDRGSFRTWLYRIARNLVLNRVRSRRRAARARSVKLACDDEPAPPAPTSASPTSQLLRALDGAVARLPSPLSDVYHLRSSGLSYEEMAIVLGIPLGTLKSRMSQMVNVLREELKPWTAR